MNGLKLWIARNKDGLLYLWKETEKGHLGVVGDLNPSDFPEVTWENSPQKVELKLCNTDFDRILEENKDVLKRIKENGD